MRRLGATKVQLGIQILDDKVSQLNQRDETVSDVAKAFQILRSLGFKIHVHMMPNLYGATPEKDIESYRQLFEDPRFKPDEIKIYPTSVIKNTKLYNLLESAEYEPYDTDVLINLVSRMLEITPEYCRITRVIRDIPSTEIEGGNKTTNLRQVVENRLKKENRANRNIRAREVKDQSLSKESLKFDEITYKVSNGTEKFLQFITEDRKIAGFLRLHIPNEKKNTVLEELNGCAMIREIHVYGPSLEISKDSSGEAQHLGLGKSLIQRAREISKEYGFSKLAVISSIGTREYYKKHGFELTGLYQVAEI